MNDERNQPFYEVIKKAEIVIEKGGTVYQKFTCDRCGDRQMIDEPNRFYRLGRCGECGYITNIEETGCGFLAHFSA